MQTNRPTAHPYKVNGSVAEKEIRKMLKLLAKTPGKCVHIADNGQPAAVMLSEEKYKKLNALNDAIDAGFAEEDLLAAARGGKKEIQRILEVVEGRKEMVLLTNPINEKPIAAVIGLTDVHSLLKHFEDLKEVLNPEAAKGTMVLNEKIDDHNHDHMIICLHDDGKFVFMVQPEENGERIVEAFRAIHEFFNERPEELEKIAKPFACSPIIH